MIKSIVSDLGIEDFDSYQLYMRQKKTFGLSKEDVCSLSPDTINSRDFWAWTISSPFEKDTVSHGASKNASIKECNDQNRNYAWEVCILNYYMRWSDTGARMSVLDIGAGYGFFKEMCEARSRTYYVGVDVHPRISGIMPLDDNDTLLPDDVVSDGPYDIVLASNVFQHLTPRQRRSYYRQVMPLLTDSVGVFSVSQLVIDNMPADIGFRCNGRVYVCHYGQFTEVQSREDIELDLRIAGLQIVSSVYRGYDICHHCVRKNAH